MPDFYGTAYADPTSQLTPIIDAAVGRGNVKAIVSHYAAAGTEVAADRIFIGKAPSHWRMLPISEIRNDVVMAAAGTFDFGDTANPAALVSNAAGDSATTKPAMSAVDIANMSKPLWEVLGYTEDPRKDLDLIITLDNNLNGAGDFLAVLLFSAP